MLGNIIRFGGLKGAPMVTDVRYALSKCSKDILTVKWNYKTFATTNMPGKMFRYGVCQFVFWLSWGPLWLQRASMVPVGRYAFPESRKGLVSVKNGIMR